MLVKVFTQKGCPKCPKAKETAKRLEKKKIPVSYFDIQTIDGLAEAQFHQVLSTPAFVIVDENDKEIASFRGEVPSTQEIKKLIFY
jgi:thiol-disulfide isomerase/thioredoxin